MYIVRDIFQLKFGHFKDAKALLEDAKSKNLAPGGEGARILTDFTGDAYRLIMELTFPSLAEYEKTITSELQKPGWQEWYEGFKQHVESSHREILKQIM